MGLKQRLMVQVTQQKTFLITTLLLVAAIVIKILWVEPQFNYWVKVHLDAMEQRLLTVLKDGHFCAIDDEVCQIVREMSEQGQASIPYLIRAKKKVRCDYVYGFIDDLILEKCKEYPEAFKVIMQDRSLSNVMRWTAVNAARGQYNNMFTQPLIDIINSQDEYNLRLQAFLAFSDTSADNVKKSEEGLITLLSEPNFPYQFKPDIFKLLTMIHSQKAIPILIRSLDDNEIDRTCLENGKVKEDAIKDLAYAALKEITGKDFGLNPQVWEKVYGNFDDQH